MGCKTDEVDGVEDGVIPGKISAGDEADDAWCGGAIR